MEDLDSELKVYLEEIDGIGECLRHPLVFSVPYSNMFNEHLNKQLSYKKGLLKKYLSEHNFLSYIFSHERPYRLQAFLDIQSEISDRAYWSSLADIWIDSEAPSINLDIWKNLFLSNRRDRSNLMTLEEQEVLNNLPDTLAIYRGGLDDSGISWTLNKERAKWFQKRYGKQLNFFEKTINRIDIICYLNGRGEDEVIWFKKEEV